MPRARPFGTCWATMDLATCSGRLGHFRRLDVSCPAALGDGMRIYTLNRAIFIKIVRSTQMSPPHSRRRMHMPTAVTSRLCRGEECQLVIYLTAGPQLQNLERKGGKGVGVSTPACLIYTTLLVVACAQVSLRTFPDDV
mmetsp:Transcript_18875/g.50231  ORF Transcript_18875/g.50231 Transcript_18875/m.50231 type:complete len:139 (+) Transcript_18875:101-517(+)